MCGIAGLLHTDQSEVDREVLAKMTYAIRHRGPDADGLYLRDSIGLGHRRLSIIDPALGAQPMLSGDESCAISFNGEIYNFRELREQLEHLGHAFRTNCDTEVVLAAYQAWGADCVRKFRGMFAFGIADFNKRQLFLARDHLGIKPLVVGFHDGRVAFASELGALREVPKLCTRGNLFAVELLLRYGYVPTPFTIFADVWKLAPGCSLTIGFDGSLHGPDRFASLPFISEPNHRQASEAELIEECHNVIRDSVQAHLVADVPFGVFCSGGVDSTLVASMMQEILQQPVQAFAIGFEEEEFSELPYAQQAADTLGLKLHTKIIRHDALNLLKELLPHYGEPFADSSAIAVWHVSKLAREHVPMVLSGDGGDEAFAGYGTYERWLADAGATGNDLQRWQSQFLGIKESVRQSFWKPELQELSKRPCPLFAAAHERAQQLDRMSYAQCLDYQTYLPCDILSKVDIASMCHGLEVRTPLVDRIVVDYAASLPPQWRASTVSGKLVGKYLLKKILERRFPASFVQRRKQGFALPIVNWFLPGQSGEQMLSELLSETNAPLQEMFSIPVLQVRLRAHSKTNNYGMGLWTILVLGLWLKQNPRLSWTDTNLGGGNARWLPYS